MPKKWYIIMALVVSIMLLSGCASEQGATESSALSTEPVVQVETTVAEETLPSFVEKPFIEIDTPYALLQYPSRWEDTIRIVQTEGDVYTVAFYGTVEGHNEQHLFDIVFGDAAGFQIGKIAVNGDTVCMNLVTYELVTDDSWSEDEILELNGMREDVQYIINSISKLIADFESSYFSIETPYATLRYPAMWEDSVRIVHQDGTPYVLEFYAVLENRGEIPLFKLLFNGNDGDCLGYVYYEGEKIELSIVSHPVESDDTWTDEEISAVFGMKDDVNYIITALVETGLFQYPEE